METRLDRPNELVQDQSHAACSLDASHVLTWRKSRLAAETGKPAETLMNVVALIARRFGTDVCSAYLLEPDRANLVLAATLGLRQECVASCAWRFTKGSPAGRGTGSSGGRGAGEESSPLQVFSEAGEDTYHSFLGVPLIDRGVLQGRAGGANRGAASLSGE